MDFRPVLIWWVIISIFGLVGWPVAFSWLRHLPDRGFAFARPVGLLMAGYILWLGGTFRLLQNSTGGVLAALGVTLVLGLIWQRQRRVGDDDLSMLGWLRREWRYALSVELLFGVAYVGWAIFKAYNPNIETAGGEKWMEIAFINGTLRSDYFPPQDPWLSGFAISYYYFGYVLMAMVTRLTGLVSTIAFNLYIPTLFAMTLAAACGILANLVALYRTAILPNPDPQSTDPNAQLATRNPQSAIRNPQSAIHIPKSATLTGFVAALFVAILGNLEGLLEVLHKRGLLSPDFWGWLDIRDLKIPPIGPGGWIPDRFIWWWRGSRVLTDYTLTGQEQEVIDEFPFFSFLLGDVHPHVLALPFVLLVVALALNLLSSPSTGGSGAAEVAPAATLLDRLRTYVRNSWLDLRQATGGRTGFILYALALGALSFLNTWDFPIYLGVMGLSYILWLFYHSGDWEHALQRGVAGVVLLGAVGIGLYFPFYATFQSQARGILPNMWNPTRLPQFFVFFGPFLLAAVMLLLVLSRRYRGWAGNLRWSLLLTILGPVVVMFLALGGLLISPAGRSYVQGILNNPEVQQHLGQMSVSALVMKSLWRRAVNPWTFLFLGGLVGWALALFAGHGVIAPPAAQADAMTADKPPSSRLPAALLERFVLILLIVGLALPLAVEFIYLRDNFGIRMNTIFKFYFQAWVLLALVSAFAVYFVGRHVKGIPAVLWQVSMALLVAGGMVYPVLAIPNKADYFRSKPTLNGIRWVSEQIPGDYAAIEWLRKNAPAGAVVLEAPGKSYAAYQYTGRISAMTGIPTLLGWGGHESQWRGNYDEPARREPDIDLLFNTVDLQQTKMLLEKYHIMYVVIGPLERERYSAPGLNKFSRLMDVAFQSGDVTIYKRR